MPRILIQLEGGLIFSNVISDEPVECMIIDLDADEAEQVEDLELLPEEGGKAITGRRFDVEEDELMIEHYFNQLPDQDE